MLVGKDCSNVLNSDLMVDNWETKYVDNKITGELCLSEKYSGMTNIEQTDKQTYLGFVISCQGDNMANIEQIKKKSFGIIRKLINRLNSMNLQKYYFECSIIFLNAILRPSILYACEMYYDLKESQIRQIERIEENFMRQVLKTSRGCPIVQLYLELGHTPARYEIKKMRLAYLQYILQQSENSLLNKFFKLQLNQPSKGDWASTCLLDIKELGIDKSLEEIKLMTKNKFMTILKESVKVISLEYLTGKQKFKGKEIEYEKVEMSEYLLPTYQKLSIEERRKLFSIRNKMINIPANFSKSNSEVKCVCGQTENMTHLYNCEILNTEKPEVLYEQVYSGNIREQVEILKRFELILEERDRILKNVSP